MIIKPEYFIMVGNMFYKSGYVYDGSVTLAVNQKEAARYTDDEELKKVVATLSLNAVPFTLLRVNMNAEVQVVANVVEKVDA